MACGVVMASALFDAHRIILAPMAGVSDAIFRQLCIELGAELTYTEMVSAKALSYSNKKTQGLLELAECEQKVSVQIFGHEPSTMADQAAEVEQLLGARLFAIDVNMGCPARKIAGKGDGAALMEDPNLAASIIRAIVQRVHCPVTVKFRRGYEVGNETALDFARRMEDAGASAVAVHGRYAQQFYRGHADWNIIKQITEALSIPVIGNGDIVDGKTACAMRDDTGCAAVMVGRAAQGNPWIFQDIALRFAGQDSFVYPSAQEKMALATRHARLLFESSPASMVKMRKHAMWYTAGLKGAVAARRALTTATTFEDFKVIFDQIACANDGSVT